MDGKAVVWQSSKTVSLYRTVLNQFALVFPELPETPEPIERFIASLDVAPYTRYTYLVKLRTFYRWCSRRLNVPDPTPLVERLSGKRPRPRILSLSELRQLLSHPGHPEFDRLVLNLLADTGIRNAEAATLTRANVLVDSIIVMGKAQTEREVPCSIDLCDALRALITDPPIGYHPDALKKLVRRAFYRAGFSGRKLGPHLLRHTFATLWEGSDADLQAILGHSSPAMTLWYRQFRLSRAKRDHARCSPRRQAMLGPPQTQLPLWK